MISAVKINDKKLLDYSFKIIHEKNDSNPYELYKEQDIISFGQYLEKEPYWVVTIYNFTTRGDCGIDIVLNRKGLLSLDTFEKIGFICSDYIFRQNNCMRVSTSIRESNTKSLKLTKAFGFKVEGIIRKGYNYPKVEDKILLGMLKEECPWLKGDL